MQQRAAVAIILGGAPSHDGAFASAARFADIERIVETMHARGLHVTLVTRDGATLTSPGTAALATVTLRGLDETSYDALFVLDGLGTCRDLRDDLAFARIVRRFDVTPRPLAFAGSGIEAAAALRRTDGAPFLRNRRVAATAATAALLRRVGAETLVEPSDAEHVSVDGYLVTSQTVRSLEATAHIVVAYLVAPLRRRAMRAS